MVTLVTTGSEIMVTITTRVVMTSITIPTQTIAAMQATTVAICSEVGTNNHNYSNRRSSDDSNRVVVLITDIIKIFVRMRIVKSGGTYPNASLVGKKGNPPMDKGDNGNESTVAADD